MRYFPKLGFRSAARSLLLPAVVFATAIAPAHADDDGGKAVVLVGTYLCTGGGGMTHSMDFSASELGTFHIAQSHNNLDPGGCTNPRGPALRSMAESFGCSVGTLGNGPVTNGYNIRFGFVCRGTKASITNIIDSLSKEVVRPEGG